MSLIKDGAALKKMVFTVVPIVVILALGGMGITFHSQIVKLNRELRGQKTDYEKTDLANIELKNSLAKSQNELAKKERDYQLVVGERDSLLVQTKGLLLDRNLARELEGTLEKAKQELSGLQEENRAIKSERQELEQRVESLEAVKKQLLLEKEQLSAQAEELKTKYGIQRLEKESADYKKQNAELTAGLKKANADFDQTKQGELKAKEEIKQLIRKLTQLEKGHAEKIAKLDRLYAEAVKKNELLLKRIDSTPTQFASLAKQNKALIKETARMHYNLGVFYNKQKQYGRAAAEFEKAVELTPDDAYSYFNLGYIYAEYVVNRAKAITYFKKYLQYAKRDDKDADWAKKYIITWEAWQGGQPQE